MPEDTSNFETLDLRFRVQPPKRTAWLPGGVIVWFLVGVGVGGFFWLYGRKELAKRLRQQVASESTTDSLYAIEALESLDPNRIDHLVSGLTHVDSRVAKVAFDRLSAHIDSWKDREVVEQHTAMRSLAEQLKTVPASIQSNNLPYLRGLAAKIYSMAMAQDDPNLKPVITICQRLVALEQLDDKTLVREIASDSKVPATDLKQVPPSPLTSNPEGTSAARNDSTLSDSAFSNQRPQPPASLYLVPGATRPRSVDLAGSRSQTTNTRMSTINIDGRNSAESASTAQENQSSLPVVLRTPASIASTPVAQMKVVTNSPDLAGIEKLEIAELVRLLGHQDSNVAKAAALALRAKGLDESKIQLASELAVGSAQQRLRMVQQIASSEMDPRPWLLWMAEDGEPEVRRMAISLLTPMADESVYRSLRNLQAREPNNELRELITRALLTQR